MPLCEDRNRRGSKGEVIHECRRCLEYRSDSPSASGAVTPEWKRWRWVGGGGPTPSHRGREQTILTGSLSRRFARPLNHVCPARGARTPERAGTPRYPSPPAENAPSRILRPIETHLQQPSPFNSDAALQVQPRCKWHASASTSSRAPPDPPRRRDNQREQRSRSSEGPFPCDCAETCDAAVG